MINTDTQITPARYRSRANLMVNLGIIIITSALLLIMAGAVLGPALKDGFSPTSGLAGGPVNDGLAGYAVKQNVWNVVVAYDQALGCNNPTSTSIAIAKQPDASGAWTESWAVNACGNLQIFKVRFTPDSNQSITFAISK